jgi:hypothetical protein
LELDLFIVELAPDIFFDLAPVLSVPLFFSSIDVDQGPVVAALCVASMDVDTGQSVDEVVIFLLEQIIEVFFFAFELLILRCLILE